MIFIEDFLSVKISLILTSILHRNTYIIAKFLRVIFAITKRLTVYFPYLAKGVVFYRK